MQRFCRLFYSITVACFPLKTKADWKVFEWINIFYVSKGISLNMTVSFHFASAQNIILPDRHHHKHSEYRMWNEYRETSGLTDVSITDQCHMDSNNCLSTLLSLLRFFNSEN